MNESKIDSKNNNTTVENDELMKYLIKSLKRINGYFDEKEKELFENEIHSFVDKRITEIKNDKTPITLEPGGKMILHLIPLSSFDSTEQKVDLKLIEKSSYPLRPIGMSFCDCRYNYDGFLNFNNSAYTQIFRDGCIEVVSNYFYDYDKKTINAYQFEASIIEGLPKYIDLLTDQGIKEPFYIFITFTETKNSGIQKNSRYSLVINDRVIDKDEVILPKVKIET